MELKDVQEFIEQNKDSEEVQEYLKGLNKVDVSRIQQLADEDKDIKSWLDSVKDKHSSKSLETWKTNNLQKLIDEEVAKRNPKETAEQKQIRELTERLNKKEKEEKRQALLNKSLVLADEKKLPKDILEYFLGDDEESTKANLEKLENVFNTHVESLVNEKLKGSSYTPPKGGNEKKLTLEEIKNMSPDEINQNWEAVQEVMKENK